MPYRFPASVALVPDSVKEQLQAALVALPSSNYSLLALPHRHALFAQILQEASFLSKKILQIPDNFEVFFLQGGASLGFIISACTLAYQHNAAGFIETDIWSAKAIEAAKALGLRTQVVSSSEENFTTIPKKYDFSTHLDYLHFTANNTIYGTQFSTFPKAAMPLVADMTSDIFTRPIAFEPFGLIYASLQKSLCATGLAIYIVRTDLLREQKNRPPFLNLYHHAKAKGIYHTPNTVGMYLALLMLRYYEKIGGIDFLAQQNAQKATIIYQALEKNAHFLLHAQKEDRSTINIVFFLKQESQKAHFEKYLALHQIEEIAGHRSLGGYRISLYNTISLADTQYLAKVLEAYSASEG